MAVGGAPSVVGRADGESARISVVEELLPGRLLACGGQVPPSPFFVLMLATCARSRSDAAPAHPSPPGPTLLRRNRGGYAAVSGSAPIGDQRHLLRRRAGSLRRRRPHAEALIPTAGVPKTPYVHSWHRGPQTAGSRAAPAQWPRPRRPRPRGWAVAHDAPSPGRFNGPPLRDTAPLVALVVAIAARCRPVWVPPAAPGRRSSFLVGVPPPANLVSVTRNVTRGRDRPGRQHARHTRVGPGR